MVFSSSAQMFIFYQEHALLSFYSIWFNSSNNKEDKDAQQVNGWQAFVRACLLS